MSKPTKATPPPSSDDLRPYEQHAADAGTPAHVLAATRLHANWPAGQELTRAAYDEAVADTLGSVIR